MKRVASTGVKGLAAGYDRVRPPQPGVVVLAYHRVGGGSALDVDLDPGLFAAQMEYLSCSTDTWTIDRALDELEESAGPAGVVVTFDDGTADFVDHALPALVEHGVPATYYIATDFIDSQRPFPNDGLPLTWAAVAEAASTGLVTFGSHTHTHAVVDKLGTDAVEEELRVSCELIGEHTGQPARHFAYPKGVFGGPAAEAVVARHVPLGGPGRRCRQPVRGHRPPPARSHPGPDRGRDALLPGQGPGRDAPGGVAPLGAERPGATGPPTTERGPSIGPGGPAPDGATRYIYLKSGPFAGAS